MTTLSAPTVALGPDRTVGGAHPFVPALAGLALLAFPLVLTAGALTGPPQDGDGNAAYLSSLGADPGVTGLSAGLLHYSWVLFALGVLATVGLVRGRKGRLATSLAAVLTSLSAIQLSGLLLGDWYASALARALPIEQAVSIFETANADPWVAIWMQSGRIVGFVGVAVVTAALARAGVVSWWLLSCSVLAAAAPFALGPVLGNHVFTVMCFVGSAPMFVIGARLVQRSTSRVRHEESAA